MPLNINAIIETKRAEGHFPQDRPSDRLAKEELLTLPVDILIPAALESQITGANAGDIKAKMIVEGANGPVTCAAEPILEEMGVPIIPDPFEDGGLVGPEPGKTNGKTT